MASPYNNLNNKLLKVSLIRIFLILPVIERILNNPYF